MPTFWSGKDVGQFPEGAKVLLGFNEPDHDGQAKMSPVDAAKIWKEHIAPLADKGVRLGSPSVTGSDGGLDWLASFFKELDKLGDPKVDFLNLHWYGKSVDEFIAYLEKARARFGSKHSVWVTEFACTTFSGSTPQQEVDEFLTQSIQKLDSIDWIERYSWFGAMKNLPDNVGNENSLIGQDGQLSELGKKYVHG